MSWTSLLVPRCFPPDIDAMQIGKQTSSFEARGYFSLEELSQWPEWADFYVSSPKGHDSYFPEGWPSERTYGAYAKSISANMVSLLTEDISS